jgi:sec-independent protein translocase protein TatB
MFDIGFSELLMIGVVALIVIGPERLPKVARTAGHLYGRMQRYVATVKSDISQEIELDELRRAGQSFKESVETTVSDVQKQSGVVDDYLRKETASISKAMEDMSTTGGGRPLTEPIMRQTEAELARQQSLPLDEPDQNAVTPPPSAVVETARSEGDGTAV